MPGHVLRQYRLASCSFALGGDVPNGCNRGNGGRGSVLYVAIMCGHEPFNAAYNASKKATGLLWVLWLCCGVVLKGGGGDWGGVNRAEDCLLPLISPLGL